MEASFDSTYIETIVDDLSRALEREVIVAPEQARKAAAARSGKGCWRRGRLPWFEKSEFTIRDQPKDDARDHEQATLDHGSGQLDTGFSSHLDVVVLREVVRDVAEVRSEVTKLVWSEPDSEG